MLSAMAQPIDAGTPPAAPDAAATAVSTAQAVQRRSRLGGHPGVQDAQHGPTFIWGDAVAPAHSAEQPTRGRAPAAPSSATRVAQAAQQQLHRHAQALRLTAQHIQTAQLHELHDSGRGPRISRWRQRHQGLEVFGQELNVALARDGRLVAISGHFAPTSAAAGPTGARASHFELSAQAAVAHAATALGLPQVSWQARPPRGGYQRFEPRRTGAALAVTLHAPVRVKALYHPSADELEPAYYVEISAERTREGTGGDWAQVVSARTGQVLWRHNLQADADAPTAFSYAVHADAQTGWPDDGPIGNTWVPRNRPPVAGKLLPFYPRPRQPVTLACAPFLHTQDPWLPQGATTTRGNNVTAYLNLGGRSAYEPNIDVMPSLSGRHAFEYHPAWHEPSKGVTARWASVVSLFYLSNWLHDFWYAHGFDEVAGNAQRSNLGRGGIEGDALVVQGQDHTALNNASMTTPADGGTPRMRAHLFNNRGNFKPLAGTLPAQRSRDDDGLRLAQAGAATVRMEAHRLPHIDGGLDTSIVAHEFFHMVSNRLVGNAAGLSNPQGQALGEGWSDFAALLLQVRPEDAGQAFNRRWQGAYAVGSYVTRNAYHGVRRLPYSTDLAHNGLTLRHLQNGVPLPGAPAFGANGAANAEIHNAGEIWALMLWEAYVGFLNDGRYSVDQARARVMDTLIAALKLTPVNPTFIEARNALLAVADATDDSDFLIWARAFAKRGMGVGAVGPARDSVGFEGVVESFEVAAPTP